MKLTNAKLRSLPIGKKVSNRSVLFHLTFLLNFFNDLDVIKNCENMV